jgi:hypothetical protein
METNQNNKEIVFNIPDGYEQDKESSTDKQIVFKYKQIDVNKEVEKFLFEIFDGLIIDLKYNKGVISYKKDNHIYLLYNLEEKCLYYNYYKIYSVLESKYHLKEEVLNKLVEDIVHKILNLEAKTTLVLR